MWVKGEGDTTLCVFLPIFATFSPMYLSPPPIFILKYPILLNVSLHPCLDLNSIDSAPVSGEDRRGERGETVRAEPTTSQSKDSRRSHPMKSPTTPNPKGGEGERLGKRGREGKADE